jgi:hypothetical protein
MQPDINLMIWILIGGHVTMFVYFTPTLGLAANMVSASMRGAATWMASLVLSFVGVGLGPTVVGILSDFFAQRAFGAGDFKAMCPGGQAVVQSMASACSNASADGVKHAVMAIALVALWAALHFLIASFRLREDLDTHFEAPAA